MKRREFICSASCLLAGLGLSELKHNSKLKKNKNPKIEDYVEERKELNEIYVELTSYCNLNCKSCEAFSPLAKKKEYVSYEQFSRDFHKLKELYPGKKMKILFLGGEPLLNPDITKIIKLTHTLFPNWEKSILTNGILLNQMEEDFYKTLKEADVYVRISIHPITIDREERENILKKYGIDFDNDIIQSENFYDLDTKKISKENKRPKVNLTKLHDGHVDNYFHQWDKMVLDLSGSQDYVEKRHVCPHKDWAGVYKNGRLYFCWLQAMINIFSDYFELNIPITNEDYITISEVKSADEITAFLSSPKKLCRYCKQCHGYCFNRKATGWEFSKKDIKEWT